jgi:F0F1-type ATP synthase membrane subunit a
MFTGLLQAYIFTSLAAVFISQGLEEPETDQ